MTKSHRGNIECSLEPCSYFVIVSPDLPETGVDLGDGRTLQLVTDVKREQAAENKGTVVKIGPTAWKNVDKGMSEWAAVGDYVYYSQYAGRYLEDPKNPDVPFFIMEDKDIRAVIRRA